MEISRKALAEGEKFCWTVIDSYSGHMVIYVDTVGNTRYSPSIYYSAKGFRDGGFTEDCKYFTSIKSLRHYDISELTVEELQKLFEEEAL